MSTRMIGGIFAAAGFALALAAPAGALDEMTGVYEGKMTCQGYSAGVATKRKVDVTIEVVDTKGFALQVREGGTAVGSLVSASKAEDMAKTDRGQFAGVDCTLADDDLDGVAVQGDAVVKSNGKASIKGTVTILSTAGPGKIEQCTYSVKRTTTDVPAMALCPDA